MDPVWHFVGQSNLIAEPQNHGNWMGFHIEKSKLRRRNVNNVECKIIYKIWRMASGGSRMYFNDNSTFTYTDSLGYCMIQYDPGNQVRWFFVMCNNQPTNQPTQPNPTTTPTPSWANQVTL